jgi:hypothetical protein
LSLRCESADWRRASTTIRDETRVLRLHKTERQLQLERLARSYSLAVSKLPDGRGDLGDARATGRLVDAKVARVAAWLLPSGSLDPQMRHDSGPNLILIERCLAAVISAVEHARDQLPDAAVESFFRAHCELRIALEPLLASIDLDLRRRVADLIAADEAPSPFCTSSARSSCRAS